MAKKGRPKQSDTVPEYPTTLISEDGTKYHIWPNRAEVVTGGHKGIEYGADADFDEQKNATLPKTKRKYKTQEGNWVGYTRAKMLGLI